jgi:hypothetical protein
VRGLRCFSRLPSARANVKAIQRMLRHPKASNTLNTYADHVDEDLDGVAEALDAVIKDIADGCKSLIRDSGPALLKCFGAKGV